MNLKNSKGFTLIELMIVVAIIAILAAIALPAYQNYIKRSKVTEGVVAADACKASVSEYVASQNALPTDINKAGCSGFKPSQYVVDLTYNAGEIQTKFDHVGSGVDGKVYSLKPKSTAGVTGGQITGWTCTGSDVDLQLLPASCRG